MQEWPNAEGQGDCGLHGIYMKTWRATVLWMEMSAEKKWQVGHTVHDTALCLDGCRVPLGRHASFRCLSTPTFGGEHGREERMDDRLTD